MKRLSLADDNIPLTLYTISPETFLSSSKNLKESFVSSSKLLSKHRFCYVRLIHPWGTEFVCTWFSLDRILDVFALIVASCPAFDG